MLKVILFISVLAMQLVTGGCSMFKKAEDELNKKDCNYYDLLSCISASDKIEVSFKRFDRVESVEKCETTQQPATKTTVNFLMAAATEAKVNDIVVDVGTKERVAPGMRFDFDKASKSYQYDEAQDSHLITANEITVNLACVLYVLAEVPPKSPSSGGDADFD